MKTPEQLKGAIRNIAKSKNLRPQEVLQMFLFERVLERLSQSQYKNNFILKGGLLISSMIGINERTTMDMDTTTKGIEMEENEIISIFNEILNIDVNDGITFELSKIGPIREDDEYHNFRLHLKAIYGKINSPMKIDITTGDKITPEAIEYQFPLLFEDKTIPLMAYNLETILAEKYETIISRNISTTRARDFYDLHTLYQRRNNEINIEVLKKAIEQTSLKRNTIDEMNEWKEIIDDIKNEETLNDLWNIYIQENTFAAHISFEEVIESLEIIAKVIHE